MENFDKKHREICFVRLGWGEIGCQKEDAKLFNSMPHTDWTCYLLENRN